MRTFIALRAGTNGREITLETAENPEELHQRGDPDAALVLIEVPEGTNLVIPEDPAARFTVVELAEFSQAVHTDVAGVVRSAAGRAIDAQPGSMDAAFTGMQHDMGSATVRNSVSPDPTPSKIIQDKLDADPDEARQPSPKAPQGTTR